MKFLHLISSSGMYGAESAVLNLVRGFQELGGAALIGLFDNTHRPKNDAAERIGEFGARVIRIRCEGRIDRKTVRAIREIISREEVTLLHCHGYKADIYGCLAARKMGIRKVATRHSQIARKHGLALRAYELLDTRILRHFDAVVAVSDSIRKELEREGVRREKVNLIANGIDVRSFRNARPTLSEELNKHRGPLIGTVGRLIPQKGVEFFLTAARRVIDEIPDALFAIVGAGSAGPDLERMAKGLGLGDRVLFTGVRTDMPGVYASLDIFVLPSLDEGMPMVLLEALASGCAVIATKVGAVPNLVVSGETGILVEPGDANGLAKAMISLVSDRALRMSVAARGMALVDREYSALKMAERYLNLYNEVLNGHASGPSANPAD